LLRMARGLRSYAEALTLLIATLIIILGIIALVIVTMKFLAP